MPVYGFITSCPQDFSGQENAINNPITPRMPTPARKNRLSINSKGQANKDTRKIKEWLLEDQPERRVMMVWKSKRKKKIRNKDKGRIGNSLNKAGGFVHSVLRASCVGRSTVSSDQQLGDCQQNPEQAPAWVAGHRSVPSWDYPVRTS